MEKKPLDPARCKQTVYDPCYSHQCHNKPTTAAGYCKIHDPAIKKDKDDAKRKAWSERWERTQASWAKDTQRRALFEPMIATLKKALHGLQDGGFDDTDNIVIEVKDAIKKAEGAL